MSFQAVWLASFPDGQVKMKVGQARETIKSLALPGVRWQFAQHGGMCGMETHTPWSLYDVPKVGRSAPIMALARLSSEGCDTCHGSLTKWGSEEYAQHLCYHSPLDAYSARVDDVRVCLDLQVMKFKRGRHQNEACMSSISATQPLFTGIWEHDVGSGGCNPDEPPAPDVAGHVQLSQQNGFMHLPSGDTCRQPVPSVLAKRVLATWGVQDDAHELPVLMRPFPVAFLIAKKA